MSRVYSGHHTQTGVRVAIKLIDPVLSRDPTTKQRLLGEARVMMELQSNHIVRALDVGALPSGQLYVVMDYLKGNDLDALLTREGPLPWPRVAAIGLQICEGLSTAHRGGIIHRDIKPQNCFRTSADDDQDLIKIIDFGVARQVRIEAGLTEQGVLPGTPEYMAPELVRAGVRANERTDIYAVGATLYKLLTGRVPFQGATYMETLRRHVREPLVAPSVAASGRGIPREVDELIARALAKNPDERFASAGELARALHALLERPSGTTAADGASEGARRGVADGASRQQKVSAPSASLPADPRRDQADAAPVPDPPHVPARALDSRFVLLRVSTLLVVSALFMVGTFLIRPRAEAALKSPGAAGAPPATLVAAKVEISRPSAPAPVMPVVPAITPETTAGITPPTSAPVDMKPPGDAEHPVAEVPGAAAPPVQPQTADPPIVADPEVLAPKPIESRPADDPPVVVDPELVPEPIVPPEAATPPEATVSPERRAGYASAHKLIEEQHGYLRNECMGRQAKKPLARLRFRVDVRADGWPVIGVFSGELAVRRCVKKVLRIQFSKCREAAFEYTLTMTTDSLKPVPFDPENVK